MGKLNSRVPVLVYHEIVNDGKTKELSTILYKKYIVEKTIFEKQLQYLSKYNYSCPTISEALGYGNGLNQNICCITFDDGYIGNFIFVLPLLKKYNFKATFFIVPKWIGTKHMMTWVQIKALIDEGMEIGSHTNTHKLLETCDRITTQEELEESRANIKTYLGERCLSCFLSEWELFKSGK